MVFRFSSKSANAIPNTPCLPATLFQSPTQTDHKAEHANVQTSMGYADAVDMTLDIRLRHAVAPGFSFAALPPGVRLFRNSLAPCESWDAPLFYRS